MPLAAIVLSCALALSPGAGVSGLTTARPEAVTADIPEDPVVARALAPCTTIIQREFGRQLVLAPRALLRGRRGEENLLGYWVADRMRERASRCLGRPVPFALINPGGLRADLQAGAVRVRDIFEVMPFDNDLMVAEYSGRELERLLRAGLISRAGVPCSGVRVHLGGRPELPVLAIVWEDGRPLAPDERILVASTDYLLASGDGLPTKRKPGGILPTGVQIRQLLLDECEALGKQGRSLDGPEGGRHSFAPGMLEALLERRIAW